MSSTYLWDTVGVLYLDICDKTEAHMSGGEGQCVSGWMIDHVESFGALVRTG